MKIQNIYIKNFIKKYFIFNRLGLALTSFGGFTPSDLSIIKHNSQFYKIHQGKRCFILGNGPSINSEDLSGLEDEFVFVVNQVAKSSYYEKIRPNYYFCVDPVFFSLDVSDALDCQTINSFKRLHSELCNPVCFIPARFKKDIERYGIKDLNIHYFVDSYRMTEKCKKLIDYSKVVPSFCTVVQYAITMAVYMGFDEIYLLGCDNTNIVATINSILKKDNNDMYSYSVTENENKRMERMVNKNGLEAYCESYLFTLQDYRKLYEYCKQRNVHLVNCSSNSVIDSIPRQELRKVL